uniref:Uncharacterized protein n=1 Tax=viral metagenome TaxID=1070528 RepID=A0A6C0ECW1_9ZZZZ
MNSDDSTSENESDDDYYPKHDTPNIITWNEQYYISGCHIIIKNVAMHNPSYEKNDWDIIFKHLVSLYTNDEELQNEMIEIIKIQYGMYYNSDLRTLITFTEKELATIYTALMKSNIYKENVSKTMFPYIKFPNDLNMESSNPYPITFIPFIKGVNGTEKEAKFEHRKYSKSVHNNKLYRIYSSVSLMSNLISKWEKNPNIKKFKELSSLWNKAAATISSILKIDIHLAKKPNHYSNSSFIFIDYVYSIKEKEDDDIDIDTALTSALNEFHHECCNFKSESINLIEFFKKYYSKSYGIITKSIMNNITDKTYIHGTQCFISLNNKMQCLKIHINSLENKDCKETTESIKNKSVLIWGQKTISKKKFIKKIGQTCLPCPCSHYKRIQDNLTNKYQIQKCACQAIFNINIPDNITSLKTWYSSYSRTREYKKFEKLLQENMDI